MIFKPFHGKMAMLQKMSLGYCPLTELKEIRVGITIRKHREIGREGGVMGVMLGNESKSGLITEVVPHRGRQIRHASGDLIQTIDGRSVRKRDQVVNIVGKKIQAMLWLSKL